MENRSGRKQSPPAPGVPPAIVEAVRRFNRFYTRQMGVLPRRLLNRPFSLAEARIIYELARREKTTAAGLADELGLDGGYLSRLLRDFAGRGLVRKEPSPDDGRQRILRLTNQGREAFAALDRRSHDQVAHWLARLSPEERERLVAAMDTIEGVLGARPKDKPPYVLRPHRPGDMGWVVQRHGALYAEEYGWNEQFEAFVAGIVAKFIRQYDPKRERCWIAEREGENVGSVFLVRKSETVAKLRMLLVEPRARGLGIGSRLVSECERFARQAGYRKIVLWTNSILHAARHIYETAGYRLVRRERHRSFGRNLIGETWELKL